MPTMVTARALKAIQKLPFCYICGGALRWEEATRDHVPPKGCFAQADRAHNPVILPAHLACNNGYKVADESVGQFLSLLHGKKPKAGAHGTRLTASSVPGVAALKDVNLYGAVVRWVRAFHAALYGQPIPASTRFAVELPLEVVTADDEGGPEYVDSGRPNQRVLCEQTIAVNRAAGTIDRIVGWNGKLQYECTWVLTSLHAYGVFWIDLYGWHRLSRLQDGYPRTCVGIYVLYLDELPPNATRQTTIVTNDIPFEFLI
jgi:hypothetical protein